MATAAKLRYAMITPQKARLVADQIRGMPVSRALETLEFNTKKASGIIRKVLDSAIANAEHNDGADIDELRVSRITVDEGPTYKRVEARAKGKANRILKRTSHIQIDVAEQE